MRKPKFDPPIIQAIPLSPDDLIEVQMLSSSVPVTLDLEGTCYNDQGDIVSFQQQLTVAAALTLTTVRFRLGYLFLLSAVLHTRTSGIPDGACYCRMTLVKSESGGVFPHRKLLSQGYVSTTGSIGYGSSAIQGPPTDHTFIESITQTDPAAGVDFTFTCPDFTRLTILYLEFLFTSDATVISRFPTLELIRPPANPINFSCRDTVLASTSRDYMFGQFGDSITSIFDRQDWLAIGNLILEPGSSIRSRVISIQAADQVSDLSIYCKRQTIPFN